MTDEAPAPSVSGRARGGLALALLLALACERAEAGAGAGADSTNAAPPAPQAARPEAAKGAAELPSAATPEAPAASCPRGMVLVPGGRFGVGSRRATYEGEENPYFETTLPSFCAGAHEVSTAEYEQCVAAEACTASHDTGRRCNTTAKGRAAHPINCIDHSQARAACAWLGGRLPTEVEWEYLARAGAEMRPFPWGSESPDGRTCWKEPGTCERGRFPAGAFGLHDVVGNVWEWTESWFSPYPWPSEVGRARVIRGGSWSRRFEKWLSPTLRNRLAPDGHGSHLGARCVASLPAVPCPYGLEPGGGCRFGVERAACLDRLVWNGARCARASDPERCAAGTEERSGRGCVSERASGAAASSPLDLSAVSSARTPEFDDDCRTNQPTRPSAHRLDGGEHLARNAVARGRGCKNRDVGVGWNSVCCP